MDGRFASIASALRHHAATQPDARAYVFLDERGAERASLTFAQLDRRASALGEHLAVGAAAAERALLVFPPGLDFIVGFFACQYAGIIAVPMKLPRRNRLSDSSGGIIEDCAPKLGLTTSALQQGIQETLSEVPNANRIRWFAIDALDLNSSGAPARECAALSHQALSFLQYTSGSTSSPKGVMVSHGNLVANLEMITAFANLGRNSTRVGWIPLFHDMGLIFNALQATYSGAMSVLMAPAVFVQRPLSWIRAIHDYRAETATAPNFAYDLCCDHFCPEKMKEVDLSCWRVAFNGAEPVRADTLTRFVDTFSPYGFKESALHPSYGLAEATLMVAGGRLVDGPREFTVSREALTKNRAVIPDQGNLSQTLIGCGKALPNEKIAIVHPLSSRRLGTGQVGEIWVHGPNVAQGYWKNPDATRRVFHAKIAGLEGVSWLRTGDLGCLGENEDLYITGRIKDMIIVRGANYYPQDIELTAERSHPALRPGHGAAFKALEGQHDVLVIAFEVRANDIHSVDIDDVVGRIRMSVVREHDLTVYDVALLPPGAIPRTSSGKIRRLETCELWRNGRLERLNTSDGRIPEGLVDRVERPRPGAHVID